MCMGQWQRFERCSEAGPRPNVTNQVPPNEPDFSLVLGGPLYQLYLRTRLARPPLKLVYRRIIGISAFCWLPLFLLSLVAGDAFGGVSVPFLSDIGVHARFLAALPLLICAELMVHQRIGIIVQQFLVRGIITQEERGPFEDLVASTMRLRNSVLVELALLVSVFSAGPWLWRHTLASDIWSLDLVRRYRRRQDTHDSRRRLVPVRQRVNSEVHLSPLVFPDFSLVSLRVAGAGTAIAFESVSP